MAEGPQEPAANVPGSSGDIPGTAAEDIIMHDLQAQHGERTPGSRQDSSAPEDWRTHAESVRRHAEGVQRSTAQCTTSRMKLLTPPCTIQYKWSKRRKVS
eukprot:5507513-Heterocapsa_arctica.AAC.1